MVDSFFVKRKAQKHTLDSEEPSEPSKRSRVVDRDEDITSESELDDLSEASQDSESEEETEADKRRRLAKEYLSSIENELGDENAFDAKDLDEDHIARRLQRDVAQNEGKIYRRFGLSTDLKIGPVRRTRTKARHLTCIASCWPYAYTVSKSLELQKWRLSSNDNPKLLHTVSIGSYSYRYLSKLTRGNPEREKYNGHFAEVVCVAASPNGKYVVTGGLDHRICVWSAENLAVVKMLDARDKGSEILSLAFRKGTLQMYAGCGDLKVRTFDLNQMAQIEVLYGHQDKIVCVSALNEERCVSVGARDRCAILWKIPEESRLTFRGGDTKLAAHGTSVEQVLEGSIDTCAMLDNQYFVTGSDNGNLSLWSTQRKKPLFIYPRAHGTNPPIPAWKASGEKDPSDVEIPIPQPRYITALAAIPFSDMFMSASWSGTINVWKLTEDLRKFELVREVSAPKGIVTGLTVLEQKSKIDEVIVAASLSREPRMGRWLTVPGHDVVASFNISVKL